MHVSWKWISSWVDTHDIDPQAFFTRFTTTVAEIDGVHRWGFGLQEVLVADVIAVADHPNAQKLHLATIDLGTHQVTVVCGAPDLQVGMRVPFVPPGVTLPSGIVVRMGQVRGVDSPGMLASEADLGLSDDHAGLLSLEGCTAPAGTPLPQAIDLEDVLYEVDNKSITHRPDLWGQYGMAREVAAMLDRPLKPLNTNVNFANDVPLPVHIASPLCLRYVCARLTDVQVRPSPVNIRLLLRRLGVRPISNVVDATNLIMLETGNPLHAFDARQIRGNRIEVRQARAGETLTTLDGQLRALLATDCVIADDVGGVALAGIMGGQDSEIRQDTREIVLEAASFDAAAIRKTALRLGLRTESSARFEKALDPNLAAAAAKRFVQLLLEIAPETRVISALHDADDLGQMPQRSVVIATQSDYLRQRLGVSESEMSNGWIDACLQRLEFVVQRQGDALIVTVPSFRATKDVKIAEDLVEELGRHYGYARIASQAPLIPSRPPVLPPRKRLERDLRAALVHAEALTEVILYGFDHEGERHRLKLHENGLPRLALRNTLSSEHAYLRRNLAPNLISCAEKNLQTGDGKNVSRSGEILECFEIGRVFVPVPAGDRRDVDCGMPKLLDDADRATAYLGQLDAESVESIKISQLNASPLPWQPMRLGVVLAQRLGGGSDGSKDAEVPVATSIRLLRRARDVLRTVAGVARVGPLDVRKFNASTALAQPAAIADLTASWLHPQRAAAIVAGDVIVGTFTTLHPQVRNQLAIPAEIAVLEINLDALLGLSAPAVQGHAPLVFPPSDIDFTTPISPRHTSQQVAQTIRLTMQQLQLEVIALELLQIRELEEAVHLGNPPLRALTWRLTYRAVGRTLLPTEVEQVKRAAVDDFIDPSYWRKVLPSVK